MASDVLGRDLRISSRTGSGKTVALGLVVGAQLAASPVARRIGGPAQPRALLVAPTRELAAQLGRELTWLYEDLGLSVCVVTGGTSVSAERRELSAHPVVVVGTPGRLCDHCQSGMLELGEVEALVLDEADQMLELGFREAIEALLDAVPEGCRRHLVSATFPRAVEALAMRFQHAPLLVRGGAPDEAHADIDYIVHVVKPAERYAALVNVLSLAPDERTLVFVRTRADVTLVATRLVKEGFRAAQLSGELAQAERTRTLDAFREGLITVLVCTDVASRGLDVPDVQRVVHGDLPDGPEVLTHRSGRTGRAGNKGQSILLVPAQQQAFAQMLLRAARVRARACPAPGPDDVYAARDERLFAQLLAQADEADERHAELGFRLIEALGPERAIQVLLSRLSEHGPNSPRTLTKVSTKPVRSAEPGPRRGPARRPEGGKPKYFARRARG
jgi:ATP-dependent RNA helicase DeaD